MFHIQKKESSHVWEDSCKLYYQLVFLAYNDFPQGMPPVVLIEIVLIVECIISIIFTTNKKHNFNINKYFIKNNQKATHCFN